MMFAYGLYRRGFVREAHEVLRAVYDLCMDSATSKVFPCIPSFFNREGRGGYCYLTGSATWLLMVALTQMFGLRGERGDLVIEPKLLREQFGRGGRTGVAFNFLGKRLDVAYLNPKRLDWGRYRVESVRVNGAEVRPRRARGGRAVIARDDLLPLCTRKVNRVEVRLA
jgi:hypothetical protein